MNFSISNSISKKNVLVLLYNKFANDSRVLKECTTLVKNGYQVELWAVYDPNLPEHEVINGFIVKRKFKKPVKRTVLSRFIWTRTERKRFRKMFRKTTLWLPMKVLKPFPAVYKMGKKAVNSVEGFFSQLTEGLQKWFEEQRLKKLALAAAKKEKIPFDIIHCNDLKPLPLAVEIKKENPHVKIIYDSHEYQTETAGLDKDPVKKLYFETLEKDNIPFADQVITVSPSISEAYEQKYQLSKVHVVMNCPTLTTKKYRSTYLRNYFHLKNDDIIFLFQGGLTRNIRGIEEILGSFKKLHEQGFTKHHVIFMGFGGLEEEIKQLSTVYPNIHFHPTIPIDKIPEISSSADYGIIFYPNNCKNHYYCMPNKLFEYIVCGLPTIASPLYDLKRIVTQEDIGYVTSDFTEEALFDLIKGISSRPSNEMRDRIHQLHETKYNWNIEEKIFMDLYRNLNGSSQVRI